MLPPEPVLIGAATTRILPKEKEAEVILLGGVNSRAWIAELDRLIGEWAKQNGMTKLIATGRKGWARILGWHIAGSCNNMTRYEREL